MYKLYIKVNGMYKNPKKFESLREARANARGEYVIIKEENETDTIIEQNVVLESRIRDDDDER